MPEFLRYLVEPDKFKSLISGINNRWIRATPPSYGKCPQPDYSIAFTRQSFSAAQRRKLGLGLKKPSPYQARDNMIFPFITIENKCEAGSIGLADKQNIWNMKVALDGIVTLFWRVGRLEELNGQALGLSISHNWEIMKIYAYHLVVDPEKLKVERSP